MINQKYPPECVRGNAKQDSHRMWGMSEGWAESEKYWFLLLHPYFYPLWMTLETLLTLPLLSPTKMGTLRSPSPVLGHSTSQSYPEKVIICSNDHHQCFQALAAAQSEKNFKYNHLMLSFLPILATTVNLLPTVKKTAHRENLLQDTPLKSLPGNFVLKGDKKHKVLLKSECQQALFPLPQGDMSDNYYFN